MAAFADVLSAPLKFKATIAKGHVDSSTRVSSKDGSI